MRSPIQDANAGAAMDVAPTKKHATRAATLAKQNNNSSLQDMQNINKIGSALGSAIGEFRQDKHEAEMQVRYQEAFNAHGAKTGMSEFRRDQKRTGFTEWIFNGQSPEYRAELAASTQNAASAMYVEEANFIENEGSNLPTEEYQKHLYDKVKAYTEENFEDAPDATLSFMQNWREKSNELTRHQVKVHEVYKQQKAAQEVAEGFHLNLSEYKTLLTANPEKAKMFGASLFDPKNKGDMNEKAWRRLMLEQTMVSMEAGDISALQLIKETDLASSFDSTMVMRYRKAVAHLDSQNASMLEASRLSYQTILDDSTKTAAQKEQARVQFEQDTRSVAARDTGSASHLKAVAGSDRWGVTLAEKNSERLLAENKLTNEVNAKAILVSAEYEMAAILRAPAEERREMLATRLDGVNVAMHDPDLSEEEREELRSEFLTGIKTLNKWESAHETKTRKAKEAIDKKAIEEEDMRKAGQALVTKGQHIAETPVAKKGAIEYANTHVLDAVAPTNPDDTKTKTVRQEEVLLNPVTRDSWITGTRAFGSELGDSTVVTTAVGNLLSNLRQTNPDNTFTEKQKQSAIALDTLLEKNPNLYNQVFKTVDDRAEVRAYVTAVNTGAGIEETIRTFAERARNVDLKNAARLPADKFLEELGISENASDSVKDNAYTEYVSNLHLGSEKALNAAKQFMTGVHSTVGKHFVEYGAYFKPVKDMKLEDTLKVLQQTYRDDSGNTVSGMSVALQALYKNDKTKAGAELFSLDQAPNVTVSVFDGYLVLRDGDRSMPISRGSMEVTIDAYRNRRAEQRADAKRRADKRNPKLN